MIYSARSAWGEIGRMQHNPDFTKLLILADLFQDEGEWNIAHTLRWMNRNEKWPHFVTKSDVQKHIRMQRTYTVKDVHGYVWYYDQTTTHPTAGLHGFLFKQLPRDKSQYTGKTTYDLGGDWQVYDGGIKNAIYVLSIALIAAGEIE